MAATAPDDHGFAALLESAPDLLPTAIRYCRQARDEKGYTSWSGDALASVLRWYEPQVCVSPTSGRRLVTNKHAAALARAVIAAAPDLDGFFRFRRSKA